MTFTGLMSMDQDEFHVCCTRLILPSCGNIGIYLIVGNACFPDLVALLKSYQLFFLGKNLKRYSYFMYLYNHRSPLNQQTRKRKGGERMRGCFISPKKNMTMKNESKS